MKKSRMLTGFGLLLIAAALILAIYNIWDNRRAGMEAQLVMNALIPQMEEQIPDEGKPIFHSASSKVPDEVEYPDYVINPKKEMPVKQAHGGYYVGTLDIPVLNISLPVADEWNYDNLKTSPCRYSGTAYLGNMVICAHNYDIHFGSIKNLRFGDSVIFTDMDGNRFEYAVTEVETLDPEAIDEMIYSEYWDLTLFTCTMGGANRVTVRCEMV